LKKVSVRNSNIEFLRMLSMFLIVLHHLSVHGFATDVVTGKWVFTGAPTLNEMLAQFMSIGGKLGVDIFVIITGYFMVNSTVKVTKVLDLEIQIQTYSIIVLFVLAMFSMVRLSPIIIIKSIFPVIYSRYWFATAYVILYLLSPYINLIVKKISRIQLVKLIILMSMITIILPEFLRANIENSNIVFFVLLYLIGAYIRIYVNDTSMRRNGTILTVCGLSMGVLSMVCLSILGVVFKIPFLNEHATYFFEGNSLFLLIASIGIFMLSLGIPPKSNRVINFWAKYSFGVYLLHDNLLLRPFIWKFFMVKRFLTFPTLEFLVLSLLTVITIYLVAIIVDFIRMQTICRWVNGRKIVKLFSNVRIF